MYEETLRCSLALGIVIDFDLPPHKTVHFESEFSGKRKRGELTMKRKRFTEEQIISLNAEATANFENA